MNTVPTRSISALAFLLTLLTPAFTQTDDKTEQEAPEVAETMVVWATEVRTDSVALESDVFAVRQPDHLSDLLRTIPGVDVGGAHSLNQAINIRSLDDKNLQISIDGASQNSYMYHHMGNLQIHADILQSVDVSIGKNSVVNGGLGGGVRFRTKSADDLLASGEQLGARLLASYGDNRSDGFSATGYGRLGTNVDFLAYYNAVSRGNYRVGGGEITDALGNTIPGTDGKVRGHEGDLDDMLLKFGWRIGESQRLELGFEAYEDAGDYSYRPDMGLATDLAIADNLGLPLVYPTEFTRDTLTLNYDLVFGGNASLTATAYRNDSHLWRDEHGVSAVFGGESIIEGNALNTGVRVLATSVYTSGPTHQLNYGGDHIVYETEYTTDGTLAAAEESRATALFLEDRITWDNGLSVVPGIRYDHVAMDATLVDDQFSEVSAALAVAYQINDALQLRAGSTQLFKSPEIAEVFVGAGLYDTPNPELQAETGRNTELGLTFRAPAGGGEFSSGLTLFRTEIDDYIYDYAVRDDGVRSKDNVGDMELDGFEANFGWNIGGFRSLLGFSISDSTLAARDGYAVYEEAALDRRQGDNATLQLDYDFPDSGLGLHWDVLHVADLDDDFTLDGATLNTAKDGYTVHNISARWQLTDLGLDLRLGVDNLFDDYFASHSSRTGLSRHPRFGELYLVDYEPGRNVKASLAYRF